MHAVVWMEAMTTRRAGSLPVDAGGRLELPPELVARLGLAPGTEAAYVFEDGALRLLPGPHALKRVYVEPTDLCNLDCATCMRHAWDEPSGMLAETTFAAVLDGLAAFSPVPEVFFGGYGEPLAHPRIEQMVRQAKAAGARVELITNGTLLLPDRAAGLAQAGLDRLWVSIDGATPQAYADVRMGDRLPDVLANLEALRAVRQQNDAGLPRLGIAFVAMKRNIHELPEVIRLGKRLGADQFSISNVLAHTPEMAGELLYGRSYFENDNLISEWAPLIHLPRLELNAQVAPAIAKALAGRVHTAVSGQALHLGASRCPFMEKRSLSVRWDGAVSPCLPLLHSHTSYLDDTRRHVRAHWYGQLPGQPLAAIWQDAQYRAFRERLHAFDFAPCFTCNSCEFVESNQEDCFGSTAPTCGGCLWAQGFIRCP